MDKKLYLNAGKAKEKTDEEQAIREALDKIGKKLLVMSGKGGVGKSTVATNLGIMMANLGYKTGLMDVDIHGPNLPKMLGVETQKLYAKDKKIIPVKVSDNLHLVSMGFLIENPDQPVIWRGPLKTSMIKQFVKDVEWGNLHFLVIDSPPGTGDEILSTAQTIPDIDGTIIVTTPQDVALMDSRKAVLFSQRMNLPVLGIIENMSGFVCPKCGARTDIFKSGGGERAAKDLGVPFLGSIPLDPNIVSSADKGEPYLLENPDVESGKAFKEIIDRIIKELEVVDK